MKLVWSVSLVLLLSAGVLAAQQMNRMNQGENVGCLSFVPPQGPPQQGAKPTNTVCPAQVHPHCPIAMRAQHMADGEMVKIGKAQPRGIGQWLRLTLIAPDSRRIVKATLTIRGLSPKGRTVQALRNGDDSSDVVSQQVASFTIGLDKDDVANLWVRDMTAVQSIEISSVTYADGSTWKYAGDMTCRVTPEGLMQVDGR